MTGQTKSPVCLYRLKKQNGSGTTLTTCFPLEKEPWAASSAARGACGSGESDHPSKLQLLLDSSISKDIIQHLSVKSGVKLSGEIPWLSCQEMLPVHGPAEAHQSCFDRGSSCCAVK